MVLGLGGGFDRHVEKASELSLGRRATTFRDGRSDRLRGTAQLGFELGVAGPGEAAGEPVDLQ